MPRRAVRRLHREHGDRGQPGNGRRPRHGCGHRPFADTFPIPDPRPGNVSRTNPVPGVGVGVDSGVGDGGGLATSSGFVGPVERGGLVARYRPAHRRGPQDGQRTTATRRTGDRHGGRLACTLVDVVLFGSGRRRRSRPRKEDSLRRPREMSYWMFLRPRREPWPSQARSLRQPMSPKSGLLPIQACAKRKTSRYTPHWTSPWRVYHLYVTVL